jgi:hypothetical protein
MYSKSSKNNQATQILYESLVWEFLSSQVFAVRTDEEKTRVIHYLFSDSLKRTCDNLEKNFRDLERKL